MDLYGAMDLYNDEEFLGNRLLCLKIVEERRDPSRAKPSRSGIQKDLQDT